jgi:arylsulfatase
VWYSTDNEPEHSSWPHGATTPFRGEKMTTYEGGVRVISLLRWPGVIKPGQILNGIQAHQDMFTSLAAAASKQAFLHPCRTSRGAPHRRLLGPDRVRVPGCEGLRGFG